jgi:hypothetical protein
MRSNRLPDLLLLVVVCAALAWWYLGRTTPPAPAPTSGLGAFTLDELSGGPFHFKGDRPAFITLSAIGCGGCIQRVQTDRNIIQYMRELGVPHYNVLVYADQRSGNEFYTRHAPSADKILIDPTADTSVRQWGGSDDNCWFVLGNNGELLYKGRNDDKAIRLIPKNKLQQ